MGLRGSGTVYIGKQVSLGNISWVKHGITVEDLCRANRVSIILSDLFFIFHD